MIRHIQEHPYIAHRKAKIARAADKRQAALVGVGIETMPAVSRRA